MASDIAVGSITESSIPDSGTPGLFLNENESLEHMKTSRERVIAELEVTQYCLLNIDLLDHLNLTNQ